MRDIILGKTGIKVPQNGFGALPIQRVEKNEAVRILRKAFDGGMKFFDSARAYTDSEEKMGIAFRDIRDEVVITQAKTPEKVREDLDMSLKMLNTDYIDVYQFHLAEQVYAPGDGTGMYECMLEAKEQGKIKHIGVTAHKIQVAMDLAASGLYETVQFPFSYLSSEKELALVELCKKNNVGYIAMKGLAGGLITRSDAAMAFIMEHDNVLPIWGVQKEKELDEWLSYMTDTPVMTDEIREFIQREKEELEGEFCRGCGYCRPCPAGILINNCARMSLMVRRAPSAYWLSEPMQAEMKKIEDCINCRQCTTRCPYELDIPELLKRNYEDYQQILAGEVKVD